MVPWAELPLPDWVNVYYTKPPTFIYFMLSRLPTYGRDRVLPGLLWHGRDALGQSDITAGSPVPTTREGTGSRDPEGA